MLRKLVASRSSSWIRNKNTIALTVACSSTGAAIFLYNYSKKDVAASSVWNQKQFLDHFIFPQITLTEASPSTPNNENILNTTIHKQNDTNVDNEIDRYLNIYKDSMKPTMEASIRALRLIQTVLCIIGDYQYYDLFTSGDQQLKEKSLELQQKQKEYTSGPSDTDKQKHLDPTTGQPNSSFLKDVSQNSILY